MEKDNAMNSAANHAAPAEASDSEPPKVKFTPAGLQPSAGPAGRVGLVRRAASAALLGGVWVYQRLISPLTPASCRFVPTCSAYAAEAIRRHGPARGLRLAAARIAKCHPWGDSGFDPVPD